ncbi:MAG: hypothetical protein ACWA5P_03045 [bacterium]
MKLTSKLLLLFLFIIHNAVGQDWVTTPIADVASVSFPAPSEITGTPNEIVYVSEDEDAYYLVVIQKLSAQESAGITKAEIPEFYNGIVQGAMDATNGTVISVNNIEIQNNPALEVAYEVPPNNNLPTQRFKRILYANQTIINIDFWPLKSLNPTINKKKARFFKSFKLSATNSTYIAEETNPVFDEDQEESLRKSYNIGYRVGQIIFYLVLVLVIIGIILLIRRLVKGSSKKQTKNNTTTVQNKKPLTISCKNCETENNYSSKYCKRCGYELIK